MAEKGLPAPTPKPVKTKIPVAKQTASKPNIPLETKIIIRPIDFQEGQNVLYPPNQLAHLPDIPETHHNIPPNPPNLLNPPNPQNPPNPPNPPNPQNPPPNPPNPPNPPPNPSNPPTTRSNESAKSSPATAGKLVLL